MKKIEYILSKATSGKDLVVEILKTEYAISEENAKGYADFHKEYFEVLKDNCWLIAEFPYVDRVYRDSYYHYYSSKLIGYKRDCVRVSVFEDEISLDDFRDPAKIENLKLRYRGFFVIRPTVPFIIGRSVISPKALKVNNFRICSTRIQTTVSSIKFEIEGFPHSSQDTETISCAETTIWAIMEYFGTKYPDYKPVLPSKIINVLNKITTERQIPSKGLNIQQMSYALKEFGFGTRIYSLGSYGADFKRLYSCYVESGIPIIAGIDNRHPGGGGNIGHAAICIGYEQPDDSEIDKINGNQFLDPSGEIVKELTGRNITIFDWDDMEKKFVFVDDNYPSYQKASFDKPTAHYSDSAWHSCRIKHFVAPLYSRIYLEGFEAKKYLMNYLIWGPQKLTNNSSVLVRFFLTSTRSFKDSLALNSSFDLIVKKLILNTPMPKFIWVAELSDKSLIKKKQASGILILDATEANIGADMMIFTAYQGEINIFGDSTGIPEKYSLSLPPFMIYENNLKNL